MVETTIQEIYANRGIGLDAFIDRAVLTPVRSEVWWHV